MQIAIFGLSVTSSWGNGHATFWRAICRSLGRRGHRVVFFERDQPYYRAHRDLDTLPGHDLCVYDSWDAIAPAAAVAVRHADAAIVTSYCADAQQAARLVLDEARGARVFYDMDTPVTLEQLSIGATVDYLPADGLAPFDLVLSYAGGAALAALEQLGAQRAVPIYGCVDPDDYPVRARATTAALTYLGTYAADRATPFDNLLLAAARARPSDTFIVGGPQYPRPDAWPPNVIYRPHVGQPDHLAFYGSGRFTLNLTRGPMRVWGHCPSGRLFEAAASGTPLLTDDWIGLEDFFEPRREIVVVRSVDDVLDALSMDDTARRTLALQARARVLDTCTAAVRACELESALTGAATGVRARGVVCERWR